MARAARRLLAIENRYNVWKIKYPLRPTKYHFGTGTKPYRELSKRWYTEVVERQDHEPVKLHDFNGRTWWWFKKQVYVESEGLTSEDVMAPLVRGAHGADSGSDLRTVERIASEKSRNPPFAAGFARLRGRDSNPNFLVQSQASCR
jgi:hypothetical protein